MEFFNSLNLTQIKGGTKLKQGDLGSVLSYSLTDENGQEITSFDTKTAYINLVLDDKIWFTTTTLVDISRVTFRIDKAIPTGLYYLEIKIDDYIFPSDRDSIILIEEGSTPYDLKDLVPNYDINMTISGILSDLSQKGIDISDLKTKMNAIYNNALADHAEVAKARGYANTLSERLDKYDISSAQVNNLIASSGDGTIPSELSDIRVGADGKIYQTAGQAVREQLKAIINQTSSEDTRLEELIKLIDNQIKIEDSKLSDRLDIVELFETALTLKDIYLEGLVDNYGNPLLGKVWLPKTDSTLTQSDIPAEAAAVGEKIKSFGTSFGENIGLWKFRDWKFPIIYLTNVPQNMTKYDASKKESAKGVYFRFSNGFSVPLKEIKVQGSSSVNFPKKNYTLNFNDSIELNPSWGKHKKYVLKSNFNDYSQARNVVNAKLWGDIRRSRLQLNDFIVNVNGDALSNNSEQTLSGTGTGQLAIGKNYGAIDGFPVGLMINGKWWGVYALSIPKDDWMASMGGGDKEAIVSAGYSATNANYFKGTPNMQVDAATGRTDLEIEYVSNEDNASWVKESLTNAINICRASYSSDAEYEQEIGKVIDIDSAIDYMIANVLFGNNDGIGNNYLLQTWNGTKWYFASYDLDLTFGNRAWEGHTMNSAENSETFASYRAHRLFDVICRHMSTRLIERYESLRKSVLSENNVYKRYIQYLQNIPQAVLNQELSVWPQTPATAVKDFNQIISWYRLKTLLVDEEINKMKEGL